MGTAEKKRPGREFGRKGMRGRVSETGRLNLPAEVRREVGLEKGGVVRIEVVSGAIRIRTMKDVKERVRKLARESGLASKASVADFLRFRSEERSRETTSAAGRKK